MKSMIPARVFGALALLLSSYSAALVVLSGRLGFWDDAWWVFVFPHRYRWLNAIYSSAENLHRPIEGAYWSTLYEIWGADSLLFHLASLLLYALACGLMGLSLAYLFPQRLSLALLAALFAFFLPAVAGTTYILQTDNGRLQMVFFWASVWALLIWVKGGQQWWWYMAAFGLYTLATLTYESGVLLIFTLPIWVWVAWEQDENHRLTARQSLFWLGLGISFSFGAFVVARFTIFEGGAVGQRTLIPPPYYYWDYSLKALRSFGVAVTEGLSDLPSLILGFFVGVSAWLLLAFLRETPLKKEEERGIVLLGWSIFVLGGIPYFLAGYNYIQSPYFESATRLYSSSGYGLAMLLAWLVTRWEGQPQRSRIIAAVLVAIFASYHAQQRLAWQEADRLRENIWQSLVSQVPEVQAQTVFVMIDFRLYHEFAPVIEVENGVNNYLQMLYDDASLTGNMVYLDDERLVDEGRFVRISDEGIHLFLRGTDFPASEEVILVLRRGDSVEILDRITPEDVLNGAPLAAEWEAGEIRSNYERIIPATPEDEARQQHFIQG